MPRIIYFGGYSNYMKNLEEQTANPQDLEVKKVESSSEEEEEEDIPLQTFQAVIKKLKLCVKKMMI